MAKHCTRCWLSKHDPAYRLRGKGCPRHTQTPDVQPLRLQRLNLPGQHANCSIAVHHGRRWFAYRAGWGNANVHLVELGQDWQPLNDGSRLQLNHPACGWGREDPRLFVFNDRLHVSFSGVVPHARGGIRVNMLVARLSPSMAVEEVWQPELAGSQQWEKNWTFFERDGRLMSFYAVHANAAGHQHVLLEHDGRRAKHASAETVRLPWRGGAIRGGASPVRVGDEYYHFFHGRTMAGAPIYSLGLYTFQASPPFRITRMTPAPLLLAAEPRPAGQKQWIIFPCGAIRDGRQWIISYGQHDCESWLAWFDAAAVENALVKIDGDGPRLSLPQGSVGLSAGCHCA